MPKKFIARRTIEERAINDSNFLAEQKQKEIMESFTQSRGSCDMCVFYRNEPGLYCLRQTECYPETRVLWRQRVKGKRYGAVQPNQVLDKVW